MTEAGQTRAARNNQSDETQTSLYNATATNANIDEEEKTIGKVGRNVPSRVAAAAWVDSRADDR